MKADVQVWKKQEGETPDFGIVFQNPWGNDVPIDITRTACECNINVNLDDNGNIVGLYIFGIVPKQSAE